MRNILIILLGIFSFEAFPLAVTYDYSEVSTEFNYFSLPPKSGNRLDLPEGKGGNTSRLFVEIGNGGASSWTILYSPLTVNYSFVADKNFEFNGKNYTQGLGTQVSYKFNSYRLGYRRNFYFTRVKLWFGGLLKVRDANLCVTQNNEQNCYDNVGPVPLLNVGAKFIIIGTLYGEVNVDGLAAKQGSAYDVVADIGMKITGVDLLFGGRLLGGGAENETLENFAQFSYLRLGVKYVF